MSGTGLMDDTENQRQAAVLRALWGLDPTTDAALPGGAPWREQGPSLARGLAAYQGNAQATAERALASAYPTVQALLGEEALAVLARQLWHKCPPQAGDLGLWGHGLPDWLATLDELRDWPYLADCARLDWARHRVACEADADFEAASLALLGEAAPSQLALQLRPGLSLVPSRWPVVAIWAAHQGGSETVVAAMEAALRAGCAETAVVWRDQWRPEVAVLPPSMLGWMQALCTSAGGTQPHLGAMLELAEPDFDFTAWLAMALHHGWLWRVLSVPCRED